MLNVYDPVEVPVPMIVSAVPVVVALALEGVVEICEASDEAALDRIPENSDANELETLESVAVATILESSELKDDAMSDNAAEASEVAAGAYPVVLAEASDSTEDATLETSEATDETTLLMFSLEVAEAVEAVGAVPVPEYAVVASAPSLVPVRVVLAEFVEGVGRTPPKRPLELEVLEVSEDVEL